MALTEEQLKEIARQVAKEINPDRSGDYEVIVIERFLAALPKPEAVVTVENVLIIQRLFESGNMTPNTAEGWKAALEVYTEAPIAQPASAPTGWDAEFLSKRLGRVAKLAGVSIPERFTHEQVAKAAGTILGQIAAIASVKGGE